MKNIFKKADKVFSQKIFNANNVFSSDFLDTKILYLHCFNGLLSVNFINYVDGEKAFAMFTEKYQHLISQVHQHKWDRQKQKKFQFDKTVVILNNNCLVEFDDSYCEVLHDGNQDYFVQEFTDFVRQFKE